MCLMGSISFAVVRNLIASSTNFHDSLNLLVNQNFVLCVFMQDCSISDHMSYFVRRDDCSALLLVIIICAPFLTIVAIHSVLLGF